MTNVEKKPDLKDLAKTLSDAYYHVLQHASLTRENVRISKQVVFQMTHRICE